MGFFDRFIKTPKNIIAIQIQDVQTLEVVPEDPAKFIYPVSDEHRKGMWVTTGDGRVGILHKFLADSKAEVHLTDAAGLTVDIQEIPLTSLVRAKRSELPAARMEQAGHTPATLVALGYGD